MPSPCIDPTILNEAQATMDALRRASVTLVTAESCTAGLLAAILSHAEGAGEVLQGGFVTYSKTQKTAVLGVDADHLARFGAVDECVVRQMARGALERSPTANHVLAITGVLGPSRDEDGNRVGKVLLCASGRDGAYSVLKLNLEPGCHDLLLRRTIQGAFELLRSRVADDFHARLPV